MTTGVIGGISTCHCSSTRSRTTMPPHAPQRSGKAASSSRSGVAGWGRPVTVAAVGLARLARPSDFASVCHLPFENGAA